MQYPSLSIQKPEPSSWRPPFSWSGGKSQLASKIVNLFRAHWPNDRSLISPFLGGGAVELRFMHSRRGACVASDADKMLVLMWNALCEGAPPVAEACQSLMPIDRERFDLWLDQIQSADTFDPVLAAKFFILKKTRAIHGWQFWPDKGVDFNQPKVHRAAFALLSRFRVPRLSVTCEDFREFLPAHDGCLYVDSPYFSDDGAMESVYHENVFGVAEHEALADLLKARTGWIASNNDCEWVRETYRDYPMIEQVVRYDSRARVGLAGRRSNEVIIVSR